MKKITLMLMCVALLGYGRVWYVTENGDDSRKGDSWEESLRSPQVAIDKAAMGDSIWIGGGTYRATSLRPIVGEVAYAASFIMKPGISVYGGFAGTESSPEEREAGGNGAWDFLHPTILESTSAFPGCVVYGRELPRTGGVVLDGLVLQGGNACGEGMDGVGGGASLSGNCALRRCIVRRNRALHGGGIYSEGDVLISQCLISENEAGIQGIPGKGGGIYFDGGSGRMENTLVWRNGHGGGVSYGGGVYSAGDTEILFCTIVGNRASWGGSGCHLASAGARLSSSVIWGNDGNLEQLHSVNGEVRRCAVAGGVFGHRNLRLEDENCGAGGIDSNDNGVGRYYPCFRSPEEGDFRLGAGSYLINRGLETTLPFDADGQERSHGGLSDIGAFESGHRGNLAYGLEVDGPCVYGSVSGVTCIPGALTPGYLPVDFHSGNECASLVRERDAWSVFWRQAGEASLSLEAASTENGQWNSFRCESVMQVARRPLVIAADDIEFAYGDEGYQLTWQVVAGELAQGDSITGGLACDVGERMDESYPIRQGTLAISDGNAGGNYSLVFLEGSLLYSKASLDDLTFDVGEIAYTGGQVDAPEIRMEPQVNYRLEYEGVDGTQYERSEVPPANAGNYRVIVTVDDPHYAGVFEKTLRIAPAVLTVTADSQSRMYGEENPELTCTYSGFVGGDGPDSITPPSMTTEANAESLPGEYPIRLVGGSSSNYQFHLVDGTLTVRKATLIASDVTAGRIGNGNMLFTSALEGKMTNASTGDEVPGRFVWMNGDEVMAVGTWLRQWQFVPDEWEKYGLFSGETEVHVSRSRIVVQAQDVTCEYGSPDPELTYTVVSGQVEYGKPLNLTLSREPGTLPGEYAIGLPDGADTGEYEVECRPGVFRIVKRTVHVAVNKAYKLYGQAEPTLSYTVTDEDVPESCVITGDVYRDPGEDAGTYAIHSDRLAVTEPSLYSLSVTDEAFTIYPVTPVAWPEKTTYCLITYGTLITNDLLEETWRDPNDRSVQLQGTTIWMNLQTREPLTDFKFNVYPHYQFIVRFTPDSPNYRPVERVVSVEVRLKTLTLSYEKPIYEMIAGEAAPEFKLFATGFAYDEETTLDIGLYGNHEKALQKGPGEYNLYPEARYFPNYILSKNVSKLVIKPRPIIADVTASPIIEGDSLFASRLSGVFKDGMDGREVTGTIAWDASKNHPSIRPSKDTKYYAVFTPDNTLLYSPMSLEVSVPFNARHLIVKLHPCSETYQGADGQLAENYVWSYDVAHGSDLPEEGVKVSFTFAREPGNNAGQYRYWLASWSQNDGYGLTVDDSEAVYTVLPRSLTVNPRPASKIYGDEDPVLEYDLAEPLEAGSSLVGSLKREPGENVGVYRILPGSLAVQPPNYAIVLGEAQLTVEPRPVTIRGRSQTMEYGDEFPESEFDVVEGNLVEGDQFLVEATPAVGPCPGTYEISLENVSLNGNYVLTRQPGTLNIRNRQVSLKADDLRKVAGTEDSELTYTVTSGSFAPGLVVYGGLTREAGEKPGVYRITDGEMMYPAFHDVTFAEGFLEIVKGDDANDEPNNGGDSGEEASLVVSSSGREGTFRTLEEAIARAGNGWTIFVEAGVYEYPIWVVEKSLRIEGVPAQDGSLPVLRGCLNFNGAGASSSVMTKVHLESDQGPAVVIGFDCRDTFIFGNEIAGRYIGILADNRTPLLSENQIRALFQVVYTDGL